MPPRFFVKSALAICLTAACSGAVTLLSRSAEAKPPAAKSAKQPIGVGAITGPQGGKVRAKVIKVLRDSGTYDVTDVEDIKPGSPAQKYQTMATGIQADAIVVGTVSKKMTLTLSIYAANGARIDAVTIKGGSTQGLLKEVENELEIAVADPLSKARPSGAASAPAAAAPAAAAAAPVKVNLDEDETSAPAKAAPPAKGKAKAKGDELEAVDIASTPEDEPQPQSASSDESSSDSSEASEKGQRPLELMVGMRGYNRQFKYTGVTSGPLVPYELGLAPTIFVAGRVYPAAFSSDGVLSNIGLMGRFELGIATSTNYQATPGGPITKLSTHAYEYQLGVRGRLPLGRLELGIFAVYGDQSFTLGGDENPSGVAYALVPDMHYHYIRTGLDLRAYISKLIVEAHVAPRFLTSMHEIDLARVWFPGAMASGLDGGVLLGWQFLPWLTAAIGGDFVRYGFDFNNQPATPTPRVVAGGATDTYLSGWFGVMSTFDFSGKAASGATSVSATDGASSESTEKASDAEQAPEAEEEEKPKAAPAPKPKKAAAPKPAAPKPAAKPAKQAAPSKKKAAPVPEEEEEEE